MISLGFITTSLIVVIMPGTGVIYTVSTGILSGKRASVAAAIGCTLGILPHLLACICGLSLLLHASALAFQILKIMGAVYLLYLAWNMWREKEMFEFENQSNSRDFVKIACKGFLINILNPKLSLFFLAFLPSFVNANTTHPSFDISVLSLVFMLMTLIVFLSYGFCANLVRSRITGSQIMLSWMQRSFAAFLALLGMKLAFTDR